MMVRNNRVASLAATIVGALTLVAGPAPAQAGTDELCLPQAAGVPGPQPKHPEWWDPALTANQRETRWTGSTRVYDDGSTGTSLGHARAIWDGSDDWQYFEFRVDADPSIDPTNDVVLMVVTDQAGVDPDIYIEIQPLTGCDPTTAVPCTGLGAAIAPASINYWSATNTGTGIAWTGHGNTNPSSDWTLHNPWVEVRLVGGQYRWTVKFALESPVDTGTQQVWPNLRMYGNAIMYWNTGTSGVAVEFPLMCEPALGTNDCLAVSPGATDPLPTTLPVPARWSHVTSGSTAACDGVEILRTLVGSDYQTVTSVVPGTTVPYDIPGSRIPKISGAHMLAGFHNDTSNTIANGDITAVFRLADWGLQYANWDQATWPIIGIAQLDADVAAGLYAGSSVVPLPGALETALYVPPPTIVNDHQCMHVQLSANAGGINFKRDSVYRNMNLVNASVFRRPADLSMAHRVLPPGQTENDIYLMVQTESMPSVEECANAAQSLRGCASGGSLELETPPIKFEPKPKIPMEIEADVEAEFPNQEMGQGPVGSLAGAGNEPVGAQAKPIGQVKPINKGVPLERLPNLTVSGFVDTGQKVNLPGSPQTPIYEHFSSYGYYVQHKGEPSQGFEHYIHIPGAEAVPGMVGVYHTSLAPDEVLAISNTVRVVDGIHTPCLNPPQVHQQMDKGEELLETQALDAQNKAAPLSEQLQLDAQFGCAPPPNRGSCVEGQCTPHNPIGYIEGSRYVGEWSEAAVAAVYEPEAPDELAANPGGVEEDIDEDALDDGLTDLPGGVADGCCAEASIEPQAGRRGAARMGAFALMLLLLRRGRRRSRRRD